MSQNENKEKLETLRNKLFPEMTIEELEQAKYLEIDVIRDLESEDDLDLLSVLPNVERVAILHPAQILTAESYKKLKQLPKLYKVVIEDIADSNEVLKVLLEMTNIEKLDITWKTFGLCDPSIFEGKTHLKSLALRYEVPIPDKFLECLKTLPQLEELRLSDCTFNNSDFLDILETFPNLHKLFWDGKPLTEEENARLLGMKNLDSFNISPPAQDDEFLEPEEDLSFLENGEHLKEVDLKRYKTLDEFSWDLPNLEFLDIEDAPNLQSIDFLKLPGLTYFSFFEDDSARETFELKDLDTLESLETFCYWGPKTKTPIFRQLEMLPQLEHLMINRENKLEPEDVQYLSSLRNLRTLNVNLSERITAEDLKKLEPFPRLTTIVLGMFPRAEILETLLDKMPVLRSLTIFGMKIGAKEAAVLSKFQNIHSLSIFVCREMKDKALQTILSMKELRQLKLTNTKANHLEVHDLPNLRELTLNSCHGLKTAEFTRLPQLYMLPLTSSSLEKISFSEMDSMSGISMCDCPELKQISFFHVPKLLSLDLKGSENQDLTGLVAIPKLEELFISYDQVHQDLVLETLQEMPNLARLAIACKRPKNLEIGACPVNLDELKRIQEALPNCHVMFVV